MGLRVEGEDSAQRLRWNRFLCKNIPTRTIPKNIQRTVEHFIQFNMAYSIPLVIGKGCVWMSNVYMYQHHAHIYDVIQIFLTQLAVNITMDKINCSRVRYYLSTISILKWCQHFSFVALYFLVSPGWPLRKRPEMVLAEVSQHAN